jgi:hypothetical protein
MLLFGLWILPPGAPGSPQPASHERFDLAGAKQEVVTELGDFFSIGYGCLLINRLCLKPIRLLIELDLFD